MAFVYLLANAEHTLFKIGVSIVPEARMVQIGAQFDRAASRLCVVEDTSAAYRVEKTLHKAFAAYRTQADYKSGNTEWFRFEAFEAVLGVVRVMGDKIGVLRVIDMVEFVQDVERKRREQTRVWASKYRTLARQHWTWDHETPASNIRQRLHLPSLLTYLRDGFKAKGYYCPDFATDAACYVLAAHGLDLPPSELKAKTQAVLRKAFGSVPATELFDTLDCGLSRALREYERRLQFFSDEEMGALTRTPYRPTCRHGSTPPSYEIEGLSQAA